jgi:CheY-like chemotaxis protein
MTSQGELGGPLYQLTDAAARDFSELLGDILDLTDQLDNDIEDPYRLQLHAAGMREAAQRARELIRQSLLPVSTRRITKSVASNDSKAGARVERQERHDRTSVVRTVSDDLPCGHGEKVLLVDDDARVCDSLRRLLEQLGYQTLALNDPTEALELVQRQPRRFDLILADLTMPTMSGIDLARAVRTVVQRPFVLMSGFGSTWTQSALRTMGIAAVLCKPISVQLLAHTLRVPLDQRNTTTIESDNEEFLASWGTAR